MKFGIPQEQPPCDECKMPVMFVGQDEETKNEIYRCACGKIYYERPEVK